MPDGLLQLASTIFLTFGLGTLLYALVTFVLKHIVGGEPDAPVRTAPVMQNPAVPQAPAYYGQPYATGYPQQPGQHAAPAPQNYAPPSSGYASQMPWSPPGAAPRR